MFETKILLIFDNFGFAPNGFGYIQYVFHDLLNFLHILMICGSDAIPWISIKFLANGGCLNCAVDLGPGVYRIFQADYSASAVCQSLPQNAVIFYLAQ